MAHKESYINKAITKHSEEISNNGKDKKIKHKSILKCDVVIFAKQNNHWAFLDCEAINNIRRDKKYCIAGYFNLDKTKFKDLATNKTYEVIDGVIIDNMSKYVQIDVFAQKEPYGVLTMQSTCSNCSDIVLMVGKNICAFRKRHGLELQDFLSVSGNTKLGISDVNNTIKELNFRIHNIYKNMIKRDNLNRATISTQEKNF